MKLDRTALIAIAIGLAVIPAWLLILREDERADRSTPSARSVSATPAPHPRFDPPLETPARLSSGPDVALTRSEAESRPIPQRGRVIDVTTQRPIGGALFHAATRVANANEQGEFRYDRVTAGDLPFIVKAEGYCSLRGQLEAPERENSEVIEFPLLASSPVEGRVVDIDGHPVARAIVRTVVLPAKGDDAEPLPIGTPEGWSLVAEASVVRVTVDEDGRFRLPGLVPHSRNQLHVTRLGFVADVREIVAAGPGVATHREVVLQYEQEPGRGDVVGTVHLNGKPARADLWWKSTSRSGTETTENDGFYRLGNVEAGVVQVSASPASWQALEGHSQIAGGTARLVVIAGERTRHDFNLVVPMTVISGRVIHEGGEPSAGRTVTAKSSIDVVFSAVTDFEGYYWLEVPDRSEPFRIRPGTEIGTPSRGDVLPGATEVDFVLPDLADIVLQVRDAATAAELQRFAVFFRPAGERDAWWPAQSARDRAADGFRFRSLVDHVDVKVRRRGYLTSILEDVMVLADGRTRLAIELEPGECTRVDAPE